MLMILIATAELKLESLLTVARSLRLMGNVGGAGGSLNSDGKDGRLGEANEEHRPRRARPSIMLGYDPTLFHSQSDDES